MNRYLISLVLALAMSCQIGNHSRSEEGDSALDSSDNSLASLAFDQVKDIQFNVEVDRIAMPYQGDLKKSVSWEDKNGSNTLIISSLDADDKRVKAEIFAYNYVSKNGKVQNLWQINDFVTGECDRDIYLIPNTLEVLDIDQDGIAENVFMYILADNCDATPVKTKLMMHSGKEKLMIRGLTKVFLLPIPEVEAEAKKIDPAFNKVDPLLKAYASGKWDEYVNEETEAFKQAIGE